ncbi:energy transducer TonB [Bradyrhizobium yuanmingense]
MLSASLARSAGSAELDREVIALVHRASPVPAPPAGARRSITAPVRFSPR